MLTRYIVFIRIELSCQSSPKGSDERLIFCMAAPWAFQHNSLLFVRVLFLSGGEPFNHEGVTLFTRHGCLPGKFSVIRANSSRGDLPFYPKHTRQPHSWITGEASKNRGPQTKVLSGLFTLLLRGNDGNDCGIQRLGSSVRRGARVAIRVATRPLPRWAVGSNPTLSAIQLNRACRTVLQNPYQFRA